MSTLACKMLLYKILAENHNLITAKRFCREVLQTKLGFNRGGHLNGFSCSLDLAVLLQRQTKLHSLNAWYSSYSGKSQLKTIL